MRFSIIQKLTAWFNNLPLKRKISVIALIAILVLISPRLYQGVTDLYGRASCSMSGGQWAVGGMAENHYCLLTYPDGGKPCSTSDQCTGACVLYEVTWGQPFPTEGVCKRNNNPFECFAVIEYPEFYGCAD